MLYALCKEHLEVAADTYDKAWQLLDETYGLLSSDYDDWLMEGDENA